MNNHNVNGTNSILARSIDEDGPVRILIYKSSATRPKGKGRRRFVAQSLRYGLVASAFAKDTALRRVVEQIVGYLHDCAETNVSGAARRNPAPWEVQIGYSLGHPYQPREEILADLPGLKVLDVTEVCSEQGQQSLEQYVTAA